jgi:hypothetical protein
MSQPIFIGCGIAILPASSQTPTISFGSTLFETPSEILLSFITPSGTSYPLAGDVIAGTISTTGFEIILDSAPAAADHAVFWAAIGSAPAVPPILGGGVATLPASNQTPTISFGSALAAIPSEVLLSFIAPSTSSYAISGAVVAGTVTTTDFELLLDSVPAAADHSVIWTAMGTISGLGPRILGGGTAAIPATSQTVTVSFGGALGQIPTGLLISFNSPSGTYPLDGNVIGWTVTKDSFEVLLDSVPSDSLHTISWTALESGGAPGLTVASRAALRAINLQVAGTVIWELGYWQPGSLGGGAWVVERGNTTAVDNDGTVVVPGGSYGSTSTDMVLVRIEAMYIEGQQNVTHLDVTWFGAQLLGAPAALNCVPYLRHAAAALGPRFGGGDIAAGALYFPAGYYGFTEMLEISLPGNVALDFYGEGGSTVFLMNFPSGTNLTTNFAMIHLVGLYINSKVRDFLIQDIAICQAWPASIIKISDYDSLNNNNPGLGYTVSGLGFYHLAHLGTGVWGGSFVPNSLPTAAGAILWVADGQQCTVKDIAVNHCIGTSFMLGDGSPQPATGGTNTYPSANLYNLNLQQSPITIAGVYAGWRPTLWLRHGNTVLANQIFTEEGGPYQAYQASSIAGGASSFTVTTSSVHSFVVGDYIVIHGATNAAYNHKFRIDAVPSSTTLTINQGINTNELSVYCTSLFAAALIGGVIGSSTGAAAGLSDSQLTNTFLNTGAYSSEGTVGMYICARGEMNYAWGMQIYGVYSDYGETSVFIHGTPVIGGYTTGNNQAQFIQCGDIKGGGCPVSAFGMIRVECAQVITISNPLGRPGPPSYTPAGGNIATTVVVSDGGASGQALGPTSDITVSGGELTNSFGTTNSTAPNGIQAVALNVDGTALANIRCRGAGIDLINEVSGNSIPLLLTGGATRTVTVIGVTQEVINVDFWEGRGSSVYPSTVQSGVLTGVTTLLNQFDTQLINDDGFWIVSAPDRFTITQPVYRVRVTCNVTFNAPPGAGASVLQIFVTGVLVASTGWGGGPYASLTTGPLSVSVGDYIQVNVVQNSGSSLNINAGPGETNLSIEVLK